MREIKQADQRKRFGRKLKQCIKKYSLSPTKIAQITGISVQSIKLLGTSASQEATISAVALLIEKFVRENRVKLTEKLRREKLLTSLQKPRTKGLCKKQADSS